MQRDATPSAYALEVQLLHLPNEMWNSPSIYNAVPL